ncbi:MAG: hypothetical protein COA58_03895 [Bacteroidetes bacterium]|nr:MAG: hypothetical protein COA58_03895 [Bacteroidota bacterium]
MRLKKSITFSILLFAFTLGGFIVTMPSCVPADETPIENSTDLTITGFATDKITHRHVIGDDPCPQNVFDQVEVFCYQGTEFTQCDVDSVVISNEITGMTAVFASTGNASATFDGSKDDIKKVKLAFTCAVAEDFLYKYTLIFYKDGVKVGEEDFEVDVTVI